MRYICFAFLLFLFFACDNRNKGEGAGSPAGATETRQPQFTVPVPPGALSSQDARVAYVLEHYWDKFDFTDTLSVYNRDFMEQTFANFISLFAHAGPDVVKKCVDNLVTRSSADSRSFPIICKMAERYLYEADSPMLDEEGYICFLNGFINSSALDESSKIRYRAQLRDTQKNRRGTIAADFGFITQMGSASTLGKMPLKTDYLILFFYDPECDHCKETLELLTNDPLLEKLIREGSVSVLAVYTEGNKDVWEQSKHKLPSSWISAFDSKGVILDKQLYLLRAMPSLYLLDKEKVVVLKDVLPRGLMNYLQQI